MRRLIAVPLVLCALPSLFCSSNGPGGGAPPTPAMTDVLLVGNSVSGSISFLDGHTFKNLGSVNVIPDLPQRLAEIMASPIGASAYSTIKQHQTIKHFEPAGGDRFVHDAVRAPGG